MRRMANCDDPDEIPHDRATLFALLRQNQSSVKGKQLYLQFIICDPSIYTMDYPKFIVSNQKAESIS